MQLSNRRWSNVDFCGEPEDERGSSEAWVSVFFVDQMTSKMVSHKPTCQIRVAVVFRGRFDGHGLAIAPLPRLS